jgi:hypothetical protein
MAAWWVPQDEIAHPNHPQGGPKLLFQKGAYHFDNQSPEDGVRFVWKLANGKLQARGPARIDDLADIALLVQLARGRGW